MATANISEARTTPFESLSHYWRRGQILMPRVTRWSKYRRKMAKYGKVRAQNNLAHSYAMTELAAIFINEILFDRSPTKIDPVLLMQAVIVHDRGEGELSEDTLYVNKNDEQDLREYLAYKESIKVLPDRQQVYLLNAFLLQFAQKNPDCFPEEARERMWRLYVLKRDTILAFECIERLDYILYAEEQYLHHGNIRILVQVARKQVNRLDELAQEFKPFGKLFWTPEVSAWYHRFCNEHAGQFPERRSPKRKK